VSSAPPPAAIPRQRRRWAIALLAAVASLAALSAALWAWWSARPAASLATTSVTEDLAQTLDRVLQRGPKDPPGIAIRPLHGARRADSSATAASATVPGAASTPARTSSSASASSPVRTSAGAPAADADSAPLAEGLCDALATRLARLGGLRVVPCTSTRIAVAAALDDVSLARLLGVRYVLSGDLRAGAGGRVQVRLDLREPGRPMPAWQLDEEMSTAQLQSLPGRVARAASQAVLGQPTSSTAEPQIPEQAYLVYLRAAQLARRPNLPDKQQAYELTEAVLAVAPDYEPALYMRLGLTSVLSASSTGPATQGSLAQVQAAQQRMREDIRALGRRLVEKDPASWRGHILLLNDAFMHGRWAEALDHGDALARHTASHPGVLRIAGRLYFTAGYLRRAQALARDAARLNALDAEAYEVLALTHAALGEHEAFAETLELAAQMGNRRIEVPQALLALRRGDRARFEAAAGAFAALTAAPGGWAGPWIEGVLDPAVRPAAAQALLSLDENERRMARPAVSARHDAATIAGIGEPFFRKTGLPRAACVAREGKPLRRARIPATCDMRARWPGLRCGTGLQTSPNVTQGENR
jgi:TolB-like protein